MANNGVRFGKTAMWRRRYSFCTADEAGAGAGAGHRAPGWVHVRPDTPFGGADPARRCSATALQRN